MLQAISIGSSGAATYATLNAADKGTNATILEGVTLFSSSGVSGVRSTLAIPAGSKIYIEAWGQHDGSVIAAYPRFGIANGTAGLSANIGADNNSLGYSMGGALELNGATVATCAAWSTIGDVAQLCVDLTNSKVWGRKNNTGNWNSTGGADPATNTGGYTFANPTGTLYVACSMESAVVATIGVNMGALPFKYTAPSGFSGLMA